MKKYPYLKLKIIIPTILLVLILVFGGLYMFGGLKASALSYDTLEWNTEGFESMEGKALADLDKEKLVAHNSKYAMIFDESTTIISVYKKSSSWTTANPTNGDLLYASAVDSSSGEQEANMIITYYDADGLTSDLNTYDKSVNYANVTTGTYERYYSVRYNPDSNSVDIYYRIGEFAPYIFPTQYNYNEFSDLFVGNCIISLPNDSQYVNSGNVSGLKREVTVYNSEGEQVSVTKKDGTSTEKGLELYIERLVVLSNECAKYILENGIGTIYNTTASTTVLSEYNEEAIAFIDSKTTGYWIAEKLYDADGHCKLKFGVNCNCVDSPLKINQYLTYDMLDRLVSTCYSFVGIADTTTTELTTTLKFPYDSRLQDFQGENSTLYLKLGTINILLKQYLYNYLYVGNYETNEDGINIYNPHIYYRETSNSNAEVKALVGIPMYFDYNGDGIYTEDETFQYGGYPLRDEDGNYVYDEETGLAIQGGFTQEMAEAQNEQYGNTDTTKSIEFDIAIRFQLTSEGLETTIIHDSIVEPVDNSYVLSKIQLCKYMTAVGYSSGNEKDGQIILPDGSGAVISFNSEKGQQYASKYPEKRIYGNDSAINQTTRGSTFEKLMLAMYGFVETETGKGVVAIVDEGGSQVSVNADIQRSYDSGTGLSYYNYAYFTAYLRESENVTVTSSSTYLKTTNDLYQGDIRYTYLFMTGDDLDYVDVAENYRDYLINKYSLVEKVDTSDVSSPTITFIGAYEKTSLKAGIVMDVEYSLTTFNQAQTIVDELRSNGLTNMNVVYRSWTDDEINQKTTTKVDVSNVLGNKSDLKDLSYYLKQLQINFFPEYTVAVGRGYDLAFGSLKYSSKSISGSYSSALQYVLSTGLEATNSRRGNYVSPIYYNSLILKYMKNYEKLDISGIYLSDLGNMNVADYSKNVQLYSATGSVMQQKALATISKTVDTIMLRSPFDYAFSYVDVATSVPVQTTLYGIVDYSIPLYQLVVSGLFDYSSEPVNYENDYSVTWNMLKAIETGSNLAFVLAAEDTNVLLETNYTDYYNTYYVNWKDKIQYMNSTVSATGIYESRLVDHEYLSDNVVKVKYENGLEIVINYDNDNYYDYQSGLAVASNWFAILKTGGND